MEGILRDIEIEVEISEVKRLGGDKERGREMLMVRLGRRNKKER